MANFELGSKTFQIPTEAKEHYSEKELEEKTKMYDAITYEEIGQKSINKGETSKQLDKKISAFKKKQIGMRLNQINEIFSRAA